MKVLVTGGSGFLGSHVVAALKRHGYTDVIVPRSKDYDLREIAAVRKMFKDHKPEVIIHLAGVVGGIGGNRKHPARFFYDNLMMGVQTIHEAYKSSVKKAVVIGTICAYPKMTPSPFKETDLWNGYPEETNAPYGLAKKMLLVQSQTYRQEYGFNVIYLLPVNLYGPGDNFHLENSHVIPAMIRKFSEAKEKGTKEVVLWGDGSPTREFLYVEDAAEAIVLAMEKYNDSEPVNVGSGMEISIKELSELIAKEIGYAGKIIWDQTKPNGQPKRCLDVSRAKKFFDFQASTDFNTGLKKTIQDFNRQLKEGKLREVTFEEGE